MLLHVFSYWEREQHQSAKSCDSFPTCHKNNLNIVMFVAVCPSGDEKMLEFLSPESVRNQRIQSCWVALSHKTKISLNYIYFVISAISVQWPITAVSVC